MVLAELGARISNALHEMGNKTFVDEEVLESCLKDIAKALIMSDINISHVKELRDNVKKAVQLAEMSPGMNKRKIIEKAVFRELCNMLEPDEEPYKLKKGKPNVVMMVGLQGNGKTTTCTKYAYANKKKGFKPAMICADTFRAGAFDQLKQNCTKAGIPFYGSYTETDPAEIAREGVQRFKDEKYDLIIVDTSGRHKQEDALFEEMREIEEAVNPDCIVFVIDGSVGQAAYDQALAFKKTVPIGAVIVTKLDGHAKGGGALSAVAATESPIIFIGTGEHIDEFESFHAQSFVSRLLGLGDWKGFMDKISEAIPHGQQPELMKKLEKGKFNLRILYEQYASIMKMGPMSQILSMIPGFGANMLPQGAQDASQQKMKQFMCIMDSMTDAELDSVSAKLFMEVGRVERIARGAGVTRKTVETLVEEFLRMQEVWTKMHKMTKKGKGMANNKNQIEQMMSALPPQMLQQMGGAGALQNLMKQLGSGKSPFGF
jgi:signal recognition particle subunit SRP54